jgi:adenylate kinase family enzyme
MRIHITGNAGSGKSTLAAHIGAELDLPVSGLDSIVWRSGWQKTPPEVRMSLESALVAKPRWVIEGVSKTVRQAADVVILLDVSRAVAYGRCARRNWRYLLRSRPGLPPGCPELLIVPRLMRLIWNFPGCVQPDILADMAQSTGQFLHVRGAVELRQALTGIGVRESP